MAAREVNFILCEDVRREVGNRLSFMGVFGPLVQMQPEQATTFTAVARVRANYGEPIDFSLSLGVRLDGGEEKMHPFPPLPHGATDESARPQLPRSLTDAVDLSHLRVAFVGVLRAENIRFTSTCEVKAYVNDEIVDQFVFFRNADSVPASPSSTAGKRKPKPKSSKKTAK